MNFIKFLIFCLKQWISVRFGAKVIIVVPGVFLRNFDIYSFIKLLEDFQRKEDIGEYINDSKTEYQELKRYKDFQSILYSHRCNSLLSKSVKLKLKK